jgi:hypothetical protein
MFKDRFLVVIVAGIILLVGAAFAMAQVQPGSQYLPDEDASAAAKNYILALEQQDYARAYTYLSPSMPCYPIHESQFSRQLGNFPGGMSWKIISESASTASGYKKQVQVEFTGFRRSFLFFSQTYTSQVMLTWIDEFGKWRLVEASGYYPYLGALFNHCWTSCNNCIP